MALTYQQRGRYYGDFREFAEFGGKREALILPGERLATTDRRVAKQLFDRRHAELLAKRAAVTPPPTRENRMGIDAKISFDALLQQYTHARAGFLNSKEPVQRRRYREIIAQAVPPRLKAREVTTTVLEDIVWWLNEDAREGSGKRYSDGYQRKIIDFLRCALKWGHKKGFLASDPGADLDTAMLPTMEPMQETPFYSLQEAGQILSALQRNPDGSAPGDWPKHSSPYLLEQVAFALLTGARLNEIKAQRWEWIDWERGIVRLHTSKRRRGRDRDRPDRMLMRSVPLWSQLREILRAYWLRCGSPPSGLLFPKVREGVWPVKHATRIERGGEAEKSIRSLLRTRGIITGGKDGSPLLVFGRPGPRVCWREFRVTYCSARLQTVEPIADAPGHFVSVAQRTVELEMGHASEQMIRKVYGRVSEGPQMRLTEVRYPLTAIRAGSDRPAAEAAPRASRLRPVDAASALD